MKSHSLADFLNGIAKHVPAFFVVDTEIQQRIPAQNLVGEFKCVANLIDGFWRYFGVHAPGVAIFLLCCNLAVADEFHVAPGATGNGTSISTPASFGVAATNSSMGIAGGDTVWVHDGTYNFGSNRMVLGFSGSAGNMVTWKAYPGARPVLTFGFNLGNHDYHRFQGLAWTDPWKSIRTNEPGWFDGNAGTHCEWINCKLINTPGLWTGNAGCSLIRGNVILYAGFDRREHIAYPNFTNFVGNVVGWCAGDVLEIGLAGINTSSNIIFGTSITAGSAETTMLLGVPTNAVILGNCFYEYNSGDHKVVRPQSGTNLLFANNIVAGPSPFVIGATDATVTNNTFFASRAGTHNIVIRSDNSGTGWNWDRNFYYDVNDAVRFTETNGIMDFLTWTNTTKMDINSTASSAANPPDSVTVFRNVDDPFRLFVAIYNWTKAHNVTVTLSGMIQAGNRYLVRSFQDYEGALVQSGTFGGTSISLPMTNLAIASILVDAGSIYQPTQPTNTSPNFAAFEIVMGGTYASGFNFNGVLR